MPKIAKYKETANFHGNRQRRKKMILGDSCLGARTLDRTVHSTVHTVKCTRLSVYCYVYTFKCTLFIVHCEVHKVYFKLFCVQC